MADPLARMEAIEGEPCEAAGVRLQLAPPSLRYSVRSRDAALLARLIGSDVPARIGDTAGGVARLGPDELLVLRPASDPLGTDKDQPISVVDVSERSVAIIVEGPRAAELLAAGCPLDLERMAAGRACRTIFETVEIIIWREAAERFRVEVWRSFAPWLWLALCAVAAEG